MPPPNAPGKFYPYWSRVSTGGFGGQDGHHGGGCVLEFGNVSSGFGVDDLGRDAQYGTDLRATLGYDEFEGPVLDNSCGGRRWH